MTATQPTRATVDPRVPLNRSEKLYLAFEDVSGSVTQVYALRFAQPVSIDAIRRAVYEVVRAHPRLRSIVENTLLANRLRVLPEGRALEVLLDASFRVLPPGPTDDRALLRVMEHVLAERFCVERDLPIKAKVIPHEGKPALVLSIHHIAGDGRSVMTWIRSIAAVLNGAALEAREVDSPAHAHAVIPRSLRELAGAAATSVARTAGRDAGDGPVLLPPLRPLSSFALTGVTALRARTPAAALVSAARARGTTLDTLVFVASALAFERLAGEHGTIRGRFSIDLRDLHPGERRPGDGNHVSSFYVDVGSGQGADAMIPIVDARVREAIARFEGRRMAFVEAGSTAFTWLGRELMGKALLHMKARGRLLRQSFHFSNVGRIDGFDAGDVRIETVLPSLTHPGIYIGSLGFRGHLQLMAMFPRGEIDDAPMDALLARIDDVLADLAALVRPTSVNDAKDAHSSAPRNAKSDARTERDDDQGKSEQQR